MSFFEIVDGFLYQDKLTAEERMLAETVFNAYDANNTGCPR
jgi:hypothetical protein